MAAGASMDNGVPSPEREVTNPAPNPHTDLYAVRKFSDIERTLDRTNYLLEAFKEKFDDQASKLEKITDQLHLIDKKIVEMDTKLQRSIDDYKDLDKKLDKVRTLVIGAAAVATLLSFILPQLIARIPWTGTSTPPPAETGKSKRS